MGTNGPTMYIRNDGAEMIEVAPHQTVSTLR
jgi:hypothetical protein